MESQTISYKKDWFARFLQTAIGVVLLIIGGIIYIRYRSDNLLMFKWFHNLGLSNYINAFRNNEKAINLVGWVKYSMPAGLWLLSYLFIIDAVWGTDRSQFSKYFLFVLPIVALASEVFQLIGILPGTFDYWDLLSYTLAILLFSIIKNLKV